MFMLDFLPFICDKFPGTRGRIDCAFPSLESARGYFEANQNDIEEAHVVNQDTGQIIHLKGYKVLNRFPY
jgi:hypothetical protein